MPLSPRKRVMYISQRPGLDPLQPQAQGRPEGHKPGASFRLCNFDLGALARASDRPSQAVLEVKNLPANAGDRRDMGSIPGSGRSPGGRHGNLLQYFCLENPMDRGAWRATVRHNWSNSPRHDGAFDKKRLIPGYWLWWAQHQRVTTILFKYCTGFYLAAQ